jgi:hypothetical protein
VVINRHIAMKPTITDHMTIVFHHNAVTSEALPNKSKVYIQARRSQNAKGDAKDELAVKCQNTTEYRTPLFVVCKDLPRSTTLASM